MFGLAEKNRCFDVAEQNFRSERGGFDTSVFCGRMIHLDHATKKFPWHQWFQCSLEQSEGVERREGVRLAR